MEEQRSALIKAGTSRMDSCEARGHIVSRNNWRSAFIHTEQAAGNQMAIKRTV